MKKILSWTSLMVPLMVIALGLFSCSEINFALPEGPQGQRGLQGEAGLSAFQVWAKAVADNVVKDWPKDKVALEDFMAYMHGKDGMDGVNGIDGKSAYDLWKEELKAGPVAVPGDPSKNWDPQQNRLVDFWKFLSGANGLPGTSALDMWREAVKGGQVHDKYGAPWPKDKISEKDFYEYLKGTDGKSAYEQWKEDVAAGLEDPKNPGNNWPKEEVEINDFYRFLSGKNGQDGIGNGGNGKSAYDLWKEEAETGDLDNPKEPGQKWPAGEVSMADFYRYLSGKDGVDGKDGKSAYELWKEKAETGNLDNPKEPGQKWPASEVSEVDFFRYLTGKDGKDGEGGTTPAKAFVPAVPGKNAMDQEPILGKPNVVAQLSQPEFGEYVQTTDGGVRYKVYDEKGKLAPGAKVSGLPGIKDPSKVYTANAEGEFIVPREDLPWEADQSKRIGKTAKVEIDGKTSESEENTFVPNKIEMRLSTPKEIYKAPFKDLTSSYAFGVSHLLRLVKQRKTGPDQPWEDLPSHLPNAYTTVNKSPFSARAVTDKNNPTSFMTSNEWINSGSAINIVKLTPDNLLEERNHYLLYIQRAVVENKAKATNTMAQKRAVTDDEDLFFTILSNQKYYGTTYQWNGVAEMGRLYLAPYPDKFTLKTVTTDLKGNKLFKGANGTFVTDHINWKKIFKRFELEEFPGDDGRQLVKVVYTDEAEAKAAKSYYIRFMGNSRQGIQNASSSENASSEVNKEFSVNSPYLNSDIGIATTHNHAHYFYNKPIGTLKEDLVTPSKYYLEPKRETPYHDFKEIADGCVITYEP